MTTRTAIVNARISAEILARMDAGRTVREALDDVLGAGTADKMIDEVYTNLRRKS